MLQNISASAQYTVEGLTGIIQGMRMCYLRSFSKHRNTHVVRISYRKYGPLLGIFIVLATLAKTAGTNRVFTQTIINGRLRGWCFCYPAPKSAMVCRATCV